MVGRRPVILYRPLTPPPWNTDPRIWAPVLASTRYRQALGIRWRALFVTTPPIAPPRRTTALTPLVTPAGAETRLDGNDSAFVRYQWSAYLPPPPQPKSTP